MKRKSFTSGATLWFGRLFILAHTVIGICLIFAMVRRADWQRGMLPLLGFALFWNFIVSIINCTLWVVPIRNRWIVRMGRRGGGVVTDLLG